MLRFDKEQLWLVIDCETEGLVLAQSRPWQCSWVVGQGDNILEKHDHYIFWDNLLISKGARAVTGFSDELYKAKSEPAEKVYEKFASYLFNPKYKILGHNFLKYDTYIIGVWQECLTGKKNYEFIDRIYDSHLFEKSIELGISIKNGEDLLAFQYRMDSIKKRGLKTNLKFCAEKYGISFDPTRLHEALYDVNINYKVWRKQLFKLEI